MLKIILSVVIGGLVGLGIYIYVGATASPQFLNDWIWRLRTIGESDQHLASVVIFVVVGAVIGGVLGSLINRLGAPKSDGPRY
jgi:fucose permease